MLPLFPRFQSALRALAVVFSTALVAQAATPGVRIDAGDNTAHTDSSGNVWAPDANFAGGVVPAQSGNAIDMSAVPNPAPLATYQTERYGAFTYTVPGLTAGSGYTVRLHFAEVYFNAANLRKFNVSINGTQVLADFDIFAAAGAMNKAVVRQFSATANPAGQVVIQFAVGSANNPKVCGIEVLGSVSPINANGVAVDCGGPVAGTFVADTYFAGGNVANHPNAVSTVGVTNPAPLAVYQNERWGASTYTIPFLNPSTAYTVRLHFAETWFTGAAGQGAAGVGQRLFNVSINGTAVLTNFDVTAAAGGANKAVVREFTASSDAAGQITVQLAVGTKDNPEINGIEIVANVTPQPPVITSPTTASGTVGTPFTYQIAATNSPTSFGASGLPAGLTVNTTTGLISGTPTTAGASSIALGATNGAGTGNATLTLTVGTQPVPVITSPTTAGGQVGSPFTYQITATNGANNFNATGLPAGLTVNTATGLISGTPSAAGSSTVTLSATNAGGTGTGSLTLTISSGITAIAINSGGPAVPPFVADIDVVGGTAANHPNAIDLSGVTNPAPAAVYQTELYGPSTYTIPGLSPNSAYVVRLHFAETYFNAAAQRQFNVAINGTTVLTNFDIFAAAGAANKAVIKEFDSTSSASGTAVIQFINGAANNAKIDGIELIAGHLPPPTITSTLTASGVINAPFQYQITTDRPATSYNATGMPAGLTINTTTGLISGAPTQTGTFPVALSATNGSGTGTATLSLTVTLGPPPVITSPLTVTAAINAPFSYQITATNNPTSFSASPLPAGLVVNTATGLISGTPTVLGTTSVALGATNASATGTATLSLTISNVALFPAGKTISPQLVGQNDWYGLPNGPALIWNVIADSSIGVMRIGGAAYDQNPFDNATLLAHVQRIRDAGAEPLVQVSRFAGAARAADMVNYLNVVNHMNVKLWSIGNEPDLGYGGGDAALCAMVAGYTKPISSAMRDKDPTIKIFATEYAWYTPSKYAPLLSANNDGSDITGKDGAGRYYIDGIIFHRYPFANNISRAAVIDEVHNAFPGVVGQLLGQIAAANTARGRTGATAIGWGMGEFNISYNNPQPNNKDGMGTVGFINGQLFAEYFRVGMANGATTMDTWSVNEGGGNGSAGDLGYVGGSQAAPSKRSSYYHMQMVGDYMIPGGSIASHSSNGGVGVNAASVNGQTQLAVMILNEDTPTQSFTVRLDDNAVSGAAQTKINVSAAHAVEYNGSIPGQTTLILVFDASGALKKRVTYSLGLYQNDQAPTVENF